MNRKLERSHSANAIMLIGFVALGLLGMALAYFTNMNYQETAQVEARVYQEEKATNVSSKVKNFLLTASQLAKTMRVFVEKYEGKDRKDVEKYIDRIVESAPEELVYGIGVWWEPYKFEADNKYFGPYVHRGEKPGERVLTYEWTTEDYDFQNQEWYQLGYKGSGQPFFTEPYFDSGIVYMTMALAFYGDDSKTIEGVISVDMVLPQLQSIIDEANKNSLDTIYVVGSSGKILAHPNADALINEYKANNDNAKINSILDIDSENGNIGVIDPVIQTLGIDECGWKVVVASPRAELFKVYHSTRIFIAVTCAIYILTLIFIFTMIRYFTEKVRKINEKHYSAIEKKNDEISAIIDNVQFGLLRVDSSGTVLDGYSDSCCDLLGLNEEGIRKGKIWDFLGLESKRSIDNFQAFFEQVFDDEFLAEENVKDLPRSFSINGKEIDFSYYPIIKNGEVDTLLCSFEDTTERRKTERENEKNKALIKIVHNKEHFKELALQVLNSHQTINEVDYAKNPDKSMIETKRVIHTWKGDFSTFGLRDISDYLHSIEDQLSTEGASMAQVLEMIYGLRGKIQDFLESNLEVLKISPENIYDSDVSVNIDRIRNIGEEINSVSNLSDAQDLVNKFVSESTMRRGDKVLSYLKIAISELSQKLSKNVNVVLKGHEVKFPDEFRDLHNSLIHVVRNAVDHGIEEDKDRGNKDPVGTVSIELGEDQFHWSIAIRDDGHGIDLDKLKSSLIKNKFVTPEQLNQLSEEAIIRYIFESSVSTKGYITAISGRGVGLDAVLKYVEDLEGNIDVESTPGSGTSFYIQIPKIQNRESQKQAV